MKKDLTEFKDTVQQNTSAALSSTANFIGETINSLNVQGKKEEPTEKEMELLKKNEASKSEQHSESLSSEVQEDTKVSKDQKDLIINFISSKAKSLITSLVDVMAMTEYEDDEDDICIMRGDKILTIERGRWDMLVKAIQSDPQTYCHEPEGPPEDYENWLASFNLIDYDLKIHHLLEKSNDVKSFYDQLVPSSLTPDEFWHRYFYKLFQLRQLEFRRLTLKADSESKAEKQENIKNSESVASDLSEKLEKSLPLNSAESEKELSIVIKEEEKDIKQMLKVNHSENEFKNKAIESVGSSSPSSDHTKQSEGSEDWEKAELGDIVDEAAKKLGCKLNENPEKNENSDIGDWEWE
jgi:BSD domain-containing protein 1